MIAGDSVLKFLNFGLQLLNLDLKSRFFVFELFDVRIRVVEGCLRSSRRSAAFSRRRSRSWSCSLAEARAFCACSASCLPSALGGRAQCRRQQSPARFARPLTRCSATGSRCCRFSRLMSHLHSQRQLPHAVFQPLFSRTAGPGVASGACPPPVRVLLKFLRIQNALGQRWVCTRSTKDQPGQWDHAFALAIAS